MGFITNLSQMDGIDTYKLFTKGAKNACTFPDFHRFWVENLFERLMRLFIWEGTGQLEPKEIEQRLILQGHVGICDYKKQLTAFFGSFFGVTVYNDEFTHYNVRSPIYSATKKINSNIVIINNNSLRNPLFEHVQHYAVLLAQAEVTLLQQFVEARDTGGVPVAKNEKAKQSLLNYQGQKWNGKIGVVSDLAGIGVEFLGSDRRTAVPVKDTWEVRSKLLKAFYADIGVRASFEKNNNTVVDEVTADSSMLLYNISDMLEERKKGCERVNDLFGTSWSVRISDEIDYTTENAEKPEGGVENDGNMD